MAASVNKANLMYSVYFAPRGKERLLRLGEDITLRHLSYSDKLIGVVGDSGSGKSSIVRGMFPGLELINHDDGINPMRMMEIANSMELAHDCLTYHIDVRFQTAFTQMYMIVDFVKAVLASNRRVIVEHFDLLYPHLRINAEILIGIGEEVIITRPTVLGPLPQDLYDIVHTSLKFRKIAHTVEDIASVILEREMNIPNEWIHSDVRRGFVLACDQFVEIDLDFLEQRVKEVLAQNINISYVDDEHINIESFGVVPCQGPRIHVKNTKEIEYIRFIKELIHDTMNHRYLLVGLVDDVAKDISGLNKLYVH